MKLTLADEKDIYSNYHYVGGYCINDLVKIYNVSKETILLIVNKNKKYIKRSKNKK